MNSVSVEYERCCSSRSASETGIHSVFESATSEDELLPSTAGALSDLKWRPGPRLVRISNGAVVETAGGCMWTANMSMGPRNFPLNACIIIQVRYAYRNPCGE